MSGGIMGNFSVDTSKLDEQVKELMKVAKSIKMPDFEKYHVPNKMDEILRTVKELKEKLENMENNLRKMAVSISQMHQSGLINDEVFQMLRRFLKSYYDDPYKQENY